MYTTLDQLEYSHYKKKPKNNFLSFLKEIKILILIFVIVTIGMIVFTNIQVFFGDIGSSTGSDKVINYTDTNSYQDNQIASIIQNNDEKIQEIEKIIDETKKNTTDFSYTSDSLESLLKNTIKNYDFKFNTLPPTDRIIVPKINIDVPLNLSQYKDIGDFTKGNFDEELKQGVVLYPTTPVPGNEGNTLVFGHTSLEFRKLKENPYGTVFINIPKLENGDEIKIIWKGKLYTYQVIDKVVKTPKQVNVEYLKYQEGKYITLMGCYPIGTDKERIMVIGKLVSNGS